jgi:hypothetical protein
MVGVRHIEDHVFVKRSKQSPVAAWHTTVCILSTVRRNRATRALLSGNASGVLLLQSLGLRTPLGSRVSQGHWRRSNPPRSHDLQVFSSRLIMSVSACNPHRSCSCPSRPCVARCTRYRIGAPPARESDLCMFPVCQNNVSSSCRDTHLQEVLSHSMRIWPTSTIPSDLCNRQTLAGAPLHTRHTRASYHSLSGPNGVFQCRVRSGIWLTLAK